MIYSHLCDVFEPFQMNPKPIMIVWWEKRSLISRSLPPPSMNEMAKSECCRVQRISPASQTIESFACKVRYFSIIRFVMGSLYLPLSLVDKINGMGGATPVPDAVSYRVILWWTGDWLSKRFRVWEVEWIPGYEMATFLPILPHIWLLYKQLQKWLISDFNCNTIITKCLVVFRSQRNRKGCDEMIHTAGR